MTLSPVPQPGIMEIALYQGGESRLPGRDDVLKLSANENPYGPPPSAQEAVAAALKGMHRYPPTDHAALRAAIGAAWNLDPDRIVCGVGSDEVLQFVAHAYAGPGDEVIHTEHGFAMYPILARMVGATPVSVPERARVVDVDAVLAAVTERTRIVYLTNPGNPTGTMLPDAELARLADGLPGNVMLVVDAAYIEFAGGADGGLALASERPNVVCTRTFSKIYGLGGLRIGWGHAAREVIDVLNRLRQPFNLSVVQLAAAEAAARDGDWLSGQQADTRRNRATLVEGLRDLGIACDDSFANFVLARFEDPETAAAADAHLRSEGIIVRRTANYGLPQALRITVGDSTACRRVLAALRHFTEDR